MKRWLGLFLLLAGSFGCSAGGGSDQQDGPPVIVDDHGEAHGLGFVAPKVPVRHGVLYWSPSHTALTALPTSLDLRTLGQVAPIRDQKQCGSCWAFSITKALESARLKSNLPALDLAEQALVSCDKHASGCNGGSMSDMDYVVKTGLPLEADFPYTATSSPCHAATVAAKGTSWGYIGAQGRAPTLDEIKAGLQTYGVLSTTAAAGGKDWQSGGHMTACNQTSVNHMVALAGWLPTDELIIANSWGERWGDKGFAYAKVSCDRLATGTNSVSFVVVEGGPAPTPPHTRLPAEIEAQLGVEISVGVRAEAGVTYSWAQDGKAITPTDSLIYVTPGADTVYQLTAKTAAGTAQSSVNIKILAAGA